MALSPRYYQITSVWDLVKLGAARGEQVHPGVSVAVPGLDYGDQDFSGRSLDEQPGTLSWRDPAAEVVAAPIFRFLLNGARVHSPHGVVSVGRHVMTESLHHVWPASVGAARLDGEGWTFQDDFAGRRLGTAEHLMGGNPGNYYHWLLEGLGRWAAVADGLDPVLLPWSGQNFQHQGPMLLPGLAGRAVFVGPSQAIDVDELGWVSHVTGAGTLFHPLLRRTAAAMRDLAGTSSAGVRIYVSRHDAQNRRLLNEDRVEHLCRQRGFQVVRLGAMPLRDQVALFASARHIVAPHGAGLANLLFCQTGAALLELHMDRYVNWCFRRLAGLSGVRYGCLVGTARPPVDPAWVHGASWQLDLDSLAAVLDDPRFTAQ